MKESEDRQEFLTFIKEAVSPFHTVMAAEKRLEEAGFAQLRLRDDWRLERGGRYYVKHHDSSLFAFAVGEEYRQGSSFRIAAAHTDFPALRIKPHPEFTTDGYQQLNVEVYGGAILNTWLDRPLSAAGRVAIRSGDLFRPTVRLIDVKRPIFIIPNLAIHLNKEVNKGVELNRQTDMAPVAGLLNGNEDKDGFFLNLLAEELQAEPKDILDFELSLYNTEEGCYTGLSGEFLSAPRLDNLTSVQAVLSAIVRPGRKDGINVAAFFDHEEIGSRTKQGAGSNLLNMLLEKIMLSLGGERGAFLGTMEDSLLLSVDVGHGLHPNYTKKNDPTNKGILGRGIGIKEAASQSYATDSEAVGIVQQICDREGIPYQKFVNRSDGTSGSTLGSIASAMLPVRTVDIGVPLLAMHSARELMGVQDQKSLTDLLYAYYRL